MASGTDWGTSFRRKGTLGPGWTRRGSRRPCSLALAMSSETSKLRVQYLSKISFLSFSRLPPSLVEGLLRMGCVQLKIVSHVCRCAGESDTSHLGLWSVGRGEENRLLIVNMSRVWCIYLHVGETGSIKAGGSDFDGWFWKDLGSSNGPDRDRLGQVVGIERSVKCMRGIGKSQRW